MFSGWNFFLLLAGPRGLAHSHQKHSQWGGEDSLKASHLNFKEWNVGNSGLMETNSCEGSDFLAVKPGRSQKELSDILRAFNQTFKLEQRPPSWTVWCRGVWTLRNSMPSHHESGWIRAITGAGWTVWASTEAVTFCRDSEEHCH